VYSARPRQVPAGPGRRRLSGRLRRQFPMRYLADLGTSPLWIDEFLPEIIGWIKPRTQSTGLARGGFPEQKPTLIRGLEAVIGDRENVANVRFWRSFRIVTIWRFDAESTSLKTYVPASSVAPGTSIGPEVVTTVFLSHWSAGACGATAANARPVLVKKLKTTGFGLRTTGSGGQRDAVSSQLDVGTPIATVFGHEQYESRIFNRIGRCHRHCGGIRGYNAPEEAFSSRAREGKPTY
jgi:hypothetical protein